MGEIPPRDEENPQNPPQYERKIVQEPASVVGGKFGEGKIGIIRPLGKLRKINLGDGQGEAKTYLKEFEADKQLEIAGKVLNTIDSMLAKPDKYSEEQIKKLEGIKADLEKNPNNFTDKIAEEVEDIYYGDIDLSEDLSEENKKQPGLPEVKEQEQLAEAQAEAYDLSGKSVSSLELPDDDDDDLLDFEDLDDIEDFAEIEESEYNENHPVVALEDLSVRESSELLSSKQDRQIKDNSVQENHDLPEEEKLVKGIINFRKAVESWLSDVNFGIDALELSGSEKKYLNDWKIYLETVINKEFQNNEELSHRIKEFNEAVASLKEFLLKINKKHGELGFWKLAKAGAKEVWRQGRPKIKPVVAPIDEETGKTVEPLDENQVYGDLADSGAIPSDIQDERAFEHGETEPAPQVELPAPEPKSKLELESDVEDLVEKYKSLTGKDLDTEAKFRVIEGRSVVSSESLNEFWKSGKGQEILEQIREKEKLNKIEEIVRSRIERDFIKDLEEKNPKITTEEINDVLDREKVASLQETQKMANKLERRRLKIEKELKKKFVRKDFVFSQEAFYAMIEAGFDMHGIKVTKNLISFTENNKSIKLERFINYLAKREKEFDEGIDEAVEESKKKRVQHAHEKFNERKNEAGRELVKNAVMDDWVRRGIDNLRKIPRLKDKKISEKTLLDNFDRIDKILGFKTGLTGGSKKIFREYLESKVNPKPVESAEPSEPSVPPAPDNPPTALESEPSESVSESVDLNEEIENMPEAEGTNAEAGDTATSNAPELGKNVEIDAMTKMQVLSVLSEELEKMEKEESPVIQLAQEQERQRLNDLISEIRENPKFSPEIAFLALNCLPEDSPSRFLLTESIFNRDFDADFARKNPDIKQKIEDKMKASFKQSVEKELGNFVEGLNAEQQQKKLLSEFGAKIKDKKKDEALTEKEYEDVLVSIFGEESGIKNIQERDLCFRALSDAGYKPETLKQKGIFDSKRAELIRSGKNFRWVTWILSVGIIPSMATKKHELRFEIERNNGEIEKIDANDFNVFLEKTKTDYANRAQELEKLEKQKFIAEEIAKLAGMDDGEKERMFAELHTKVEAERKKAEKEAKKKAKPKRARTKKAKAKA